MSSLDILFARHDLSLFPVAKTHLGHSIAFVALVFWVLQLASGFLLLGLVAFSLEVQYVELINIVFHGNFVWLLRMLHMLGANFVVISTIVHFSKVIAYSTVVTPTKALLWLVGSALFLISLGTAFTGYVAVAGNMSYWAALVILNLFSVIPILGDEIVAWILGASTVTSWSLRRFTVIHFLLGVIALAIIAIHIILLHRQAPSKGGTDLSDGVETLNFVLVKDLAICLVITAMIFLDPVKTLVHPDNWQGFSRLVTPAHIEPEIYFLWTFSAIKLHNGKVVGALLGLVPVCSSSWAS
jgi:ubiquinol-cytochrome c reductase cytochrome b subunit